MMRRKIKGKTNNEHPLSFHSEMDRSNMAHSVSALVGNNNSTRLLACLLIEGPPWSLVVVLYAGGIPGSNLEWQAVHNWGIVVETDSFT